MSSNGTMQKQKAPIIDTYEDMDKHLSSFMKKGDKIAILLDYDGTLAPLVSHPSLAVMNPKSEIALKILATKPNVTLAVISGRGAENVKKTVGIDNITYAGNHGLEILYANGNHFEYEVSAKISCEFDEMVEELQDKVAKCGGTIENKLTSVSYDYRRVAIDLQDGFIKDCIKVIKAHGYQDSAAHLGIEGRPPVKWNKGEASLLILQEEFGKDWASNVKVIFAGDDNTDEDAMGILKGIGISFRITNSPEIVTFADFLLPSTKNVSYILQWLVERM